PQRSWRRLARGLASWQGQLRRFHTRWYRVRRLQAASPRTRAVRRRPRRSTLLDDSVGPVPYSRPSPECSLRSPSNCRISAASYSGTGAQAASANSAGRKRLQELHRVEGDGGQATHRTAPTDFPWPNRSGRAPYVVNTTEVV